MKKFLVCVLAMSLLFSLVACGQKEKVDVIDDEVEQEEIEMTNEPEIENEYAIDDMMPGEDEMLVMEVPENEEVAETEVELEAEVVVEE